MVFGVSLCPQLCIVGHVHTIMMRHTCKLWVLCNIVFIFQVFFIESICDDPEIIAENIKVSPYCTHNSSSFSMCCPWLTPCGRGQGHNLVTFRGQFIFLNMCLYQIPTTCNCRSRVHPHSALSACPPNQPP